MALSSRFNSIKAGPRTKKIFKGTLALSAICTVTAGLAAGTIGLADKESERKYGSEGCADMYWPLSNALELAIQGGNQEIIDHVVEYIEEYESGQGEKAPGVNCRYDQIRNDIQIYGLD